MGNLEFQYPFFLWLLLLAIPAFYFRWKVKRSYSASFRLSETSSLYKIKSWKSILAEYLPLLRIPVIILLVIALARPRQKEVDVQTRSSEGIDIVLAIDVSASMLARDFTPNRLEATKKVARTFVSDRPADRIGLVAYAGESYTLAPITTDHRILLNSLEELDYGLIQDGTAIGMGLATSVNRLRNGTGEGRVIILLTDGVNNTGTIDPITASELAAEFGLKIYTIGVGTNGKAPMPVSRDFSGNLVYRNLQVEIDEDLLRSIAKRTGGQYFRATDNASLANIYKEIDRLERKEVEELRYYTYTEWFRPFVLWAFALFFFERFAKIAVLRGIT